MHFLHYANEASGLFGIFWLLLSSRGYAPIMWRLIRSKDTTTPELFTVSMVVLVNSLLIVRMAYWDLFRALFNSGINSPGGTVFNTLFNLGAGAAGILGCAALFYSISEKHRDGWFWASAPFYPKACDIWMWRRT